jgi:hypothetical protein
MRFGPGYLLLSSDLPNYAGKIGGRVAGMRCVDGTWHEQYYDAGLYKSCHLWIMTEINAMLRVSR